MIMRLLFLFSCCAVICCSHSSYYHEINLLSLVLRHLHLPGHTRWFGAMSLTMQVFLILQNGIMMWAAMAGAIMSWSIIPQSRMENARVENGNLVIEARKESWQGMNYTSARLLTKGKMSWQYGKIEVRAKLPRGRGTWPAIWMLGDTNPLKWPDDGEVDIMEHVGFDQGIIHGSVHCKKYNWVIGNGKTATTPVMDCSDSFHVYTVEWDNTNLKISVDSMSYMSFSNEHSGYDAWPFDNKLFMILNIAVGGNWGGQKGVDDSIWPQQMLIDYVRVYQRK